MPKTNYLKVISSYISSDSFQLATITNDEKTNMKTNRNYNIVLPFQLDLSPNPAYVLHLNIPTFLRQTTECEAGKTKT